MSDDQNPHAPWWCWTENEPSTSHCRERGHDVRPLTPGTPVGVSERAARQSTSAQLRETQAALAASQQDLTRVEAERDDWKSTADQIAGDIHAGLKAFEEVEAERDALAVLNAELKAEVLQAGDERVEATEREQQLRRLLTAAQQDLKAAGDDADKQGAEHDRQIHKLRQELAGVEHDLEHTRFERDRARAWQVARNDTGTCFRCGLPIVRGQGFEPQPGTTKGSYAHCFCPDSTPTKEGK